MAKIIEWNLNLFVTYGHIENFNLQHSFGWVDTKTFTEIKELKNAKVDLERETLSKLGQDIIEENTDLVRKTEVQVREKIRSSIKKKVEAKLANNLLTKEEQTFLKRNVCMKWKKQSVMN